MTRTCETCIHYHEEEFNAFCKRNPPIGDYTWPKVLKGHSCSEYKQSQKAARDMKVNVPTTEISKRIADLFGRSHATPWSESEIKSYKAAGRIQIADLELIERYYAAERAKGEKGLHRRDLGTFLNNFAGELDRARAKAPKATAAKQGDPEGWREWMQSKGYEYTEHSKARGYMKEEFSREKRK